jgi:prepilin-type N-terminal cleavage/methylation domain-containing protein
MREKPGRENDLNGPLFSSRLRQQAGFTLVELVLTIVLVGIISGVGAIVLRQGVSAFISEDARANVTNDGRLAIERMAREIRTIRSRTAGDLSTMTAATLTFVDIDGNPAITYTSGGGNITRNGTVLASGDSASLAFSYFQQDGVTVAAAAAQVWTIEINLTLTKGSESQPFRVRVHPRNFT